MLVFFGIVFLVYGGMHLYAFAKVWQVLPHSTPLAVTLLLLGLLLTLTPFLLFQVAHRQWHAATSALAWPVYLWMGFLFLFFCIGLVFDLGNVLFSLFGCRASPQTSLLAVGLLALAATAYGCLEARSIRIERITLTSPKLHGKPVTLALVSDLHLGAILGEHFLKDVVDRVNQLKPDLLLATGDILDGQGDHLSQLAQRFHECDPPMGKYAVLGNHEYYVGLEQSLRFLRDAGFTVLRGDSVETGGILIAGVDDPAGIQLGMESRTKTDETGPGADKDRFAVLLKHQPVADRDSRFDLQLSGHIHHGQIFPFNYLTRMSYGIDTGLSNLAPAQWLYVSRGTGTWGPPIRLFAPPEITLITLKATK